MNKKTLSSLFVLFAIVSMGITAAPSAFAEHSMNATVENADGSSVPGCEPDCFIPATVTIGVGGQVTFANNDTAAHTSTAGTPADGPSGAWDSSLVMTGQSYTTGPLDEGEYPYFCMVHPWMVGQLEILTQSDDASIASSVGSTNDNEESMIYGDMTPEISLKEPGSVSEVFANIVTNDAEKGSPLTIEVEFLESDGFVINHVNYDIIASQNGKVILADNGAHRHLFKYPVHTTDVLEFDPKTHPVDIDVTFQGIGHFVGSLTEESILGVYGPIGQTSTFQVVPEFGVVVSLVLVVSIVAVIALSTKTRLVQKF